MIIKVEFLDLEEGERYTMLFGDSYKSWKEQFREYIRLYKGKIQPMRAWKSLSAWKGFGGLKWCASIDFQKELNREGVQDGEPDNPKPRQYSKMRFTEIDINSLPI